MASRYDKQYYMDRVKKYGWGRIIQDDKYYDDEDLYDSFLCFTHYAFAYLNLPSPSRAQLELADFVSDRSNPHRMLMCLRGLSKSLHAELYVVWRLLNDPDEHILVMSATGTRAVNFTQFVQKLLTVLPVCNGMQPRFNKERTSSQSFDVAGAVASDSPSVYAVGIGNQIAGFRATLLVYDDVETAQNAGSATQRDKIDHYASEAANLLMTGKDESIVLCTPHSADSIYLPWIEAKGFKPIVIPAEYPNDVNAYNGNLAPYILERMEANPDLVGLNIDERFTLDILESKRLRIGNSQYKLQYQLDVTASDELKHPLKLADLIITDVDIDDAPIRISPSSMRENLVMVKHNGFQTDRLYAPSFVSEDRAKYNYRLMSVDPSGSGSDETGIAVAFTCGGRLFFKKISGLTGGYSHENINQIATMCKDYNIDYLIVESNFGDGAYGKLVEPILNKLSPNTKLENLRSFGQKEKRIIQTVEPLLNQRKIVLDKKILDDDIGANIVNSFTYQLTRLTPEPRCLRHDDRLDAVELLCRYALELENFDEDAVATLFDEEKLSKDLADFHALFGMDFNSNNNYAAKY
jgi:hypothetical protein